MLKECNKHVKKSQWIGEKDRKPEGGYSLAENEARLSEINKIAANQLSHEVDLPPSKRVVINGERITPKEVPFDPRAMEMMGLFRVNHVQKNRKRYIDKFCAMQFGKCWLPEAERTYVNNGGWTL